MTEIAEIVDLGAIEGLWPLPGPWAMRPVRDGFSNVTRFVDTPAGTHVLRLYTETDPEAVRYEQDVMAALGRTALPFAVPAPLPTLAGSTVARVPWRNAEALASLTPLLPGGKPETGNPTQARAGGEALGHLVRALADIPSPGGRPRYVRFGDLAHVHPLAPDPEEAVRSLPDIDPPDRARLQALLARVETEIPSLYASLPHQIVHRDYDASHGNVLVVGDAISAILDFEYAADDPRAFDFAIGLTWWPRSPSTDDWWATFESFARGYAAANRLSVEEAEAVPTLAVLAIFVWLLHFVGRFRAGRDPWDHVAPRLAKHALVLGDWFAVNEGAFVDRLVRWSTGDN